MNDALVSYPHPSKQIGKRVFLEPALWVRRDALLHQGIEVVGAGEIISAAAYRDQIHGTGLPLQESSNLVQDVFARVADFHSHIADGNQRQRLKVAKVVEFVGEIAYTRYGVPKPRITKEQY